MSRTVPLILLLSLAAAVALANDLPPFELGLTGAQTFTTEYYARQHQHIGITGLITTGPVSLLGELHLQNDRRYSEGHGGGYWLGANGTLEQGGLTADISPVRLRVGRFYHSDQVRSPYSLFVSSRSLGAEQLALDIETPGLFYSTRSVVLTRDSARGYPDRGAAIRSYGVALRDLRVGFQDVLVYADRTFDLEYLVNPVPGFLLQYLKRSAGTPWAVGYNHNSIMGFFVDRDRGDSYGYAQILVDDINFNRFIPRELFWNPDKIAWSVGGRRDLGFGTIGLYHAGATMYTFQAFGRALGDGRATDTRYGYTYIPDVEYTLDGEPRVILPQDNYVGYLHGENNLAFMITYDSTLGPFERVPGFDLSASLELTVSGSKSPANPWHEYRFYNEYREGTRMLDDERLETRLLARAGVEAPVGAWRIFGETAFGFVANELELAEVPEARRVEHNEIRIFTPGETTRLIASLRVGATYRMEYRGR